MVTSLYAQHFVTRFYIPKYSVGFIPSNLRKLPSVLGIYHDTLTADMKNTIKTVVANLLPFLLAQPSESDFTPRERAVDTDGGSSSLARKLRSMSTKSFVQLLTAIFDIVRAHLVRATKVQKGH